MYKLSTILFFISFIFNIGVSQEVVSFRTKDLPESIILKGKQLKLNSYLRNPIQIFYKDSLIILQNLNADPVYDILNLKSGEIVAQFCKKGRGPREVINAFSTQVFDSNKEILVQNFSKKEAVFYSIDKVLEGVKNNCIKTVDLSIVKPRKVAMVKNGHFFCNLIGHPENYMNCLLDSNGKLIKKINKFPNIELKYDQGLASNLFQTSLNVSPCGEKVVVCYTYWRQIDIFDGKGNYLVNIKGPDYKIPDIFVGSKQSGPILTSINPDIYGPPCLGQSYFFIPFSGELRPYSMAYYKYLFCFDYEGNIIKQYELEPKISRITVDWKNKIIYGLNVALEPKIFTFNF